MEEGFYVIQRKSTEQFLTDCQRPNYDPLFADRFETLQEAERRLTYFGKQEDMVIKKVVFTLTDI